MFFYNNKLATGKQYIYRFCLLHCKGNKNFTEQIYIF